MTTTPYIIKFGEKVGEKHLDKLIDAFFRQYENNKEEHFLFDISEVGWFSNQELLVFTALFKVLIDSGVKFRVHFLRNGSSENIDDRKARQFVQLWNVWKIYQITPDANYDTFFDIDGRLIDRLVKEYDISTATQEIYENYGVTPFLTLDKIDGYDDAKIADMLSKIYQLNAATNEVLKSNNCILPFENETLSLIVTKELYENFLDHFKSPHFPSKNHQAFMSLSLKRRMPETNGKNIQGLLKFNYESESIPELKNFNYDLKNKQFRNLSYLQLSFVDFGEGIAKTLRRSFDKNSNGKKTKKNIDSLVLEYAFQFDSSQHPILERYTKEFSVPRGLFDILSIVKRYDGILIARSNYGKIAFNFSNGESIEEALIFFKDESSYFPGTLITINIPEREENKKFDYSSIKPIIQDKILGTRTNTKYVSLFEIQKKQKKSPFSKRNFYNIFFEELLDTFRYLPNENTTIYIDFMGYDIDDRISKKLIFFISTDYHVNFKKSVVILNPPPQNYLRSLQDEILLMSEVDKSFKFHPTPFIYLTDDQTSLEIIWLGVYSENDIRKLNDLLLEAHDLRLSDFEEGHNVIGNVITHDAYGNINSRIDSSEIFGFYQEKVLSAQKIELDRIIESTVIKVHDSYFLCNGNYYQSEYLLLSSVLQDSDNCRYLNQILYHKIRNRYVDIENYKFIGITTASHKILTPFFDRERNSEGNIIALNNYFAFEKEPGFLNIRKGDKLILICDVISTGYMVERFETKIQEIGAELSGIGVLINAIDNKYKPAKYNYKKLESKLISVHTHPLQKYSRKELSEKLQKKQIEVTRINPFTNSPIVQSINQSNYDRSVLLTNEEFLELVKEEHIRIGYFSFNHLIHPYFFDMKAILADSFSAKSLLTKVFDKMKYQCDLRRITTIFFPKESGIESIDFELFFQSIIKAHNIDVVELERLSTNEGWRFPHPPNHFYDTYKNKEVLVLDDGSCSGESLIQMIEEIAMLNVKRIVVLTLVGRINEHKREFFSKIKSLQNDAQSIVIEIYFASNWHIPTYYLSKSPVINEKNWLESLISLPNTPSEIKRIARLVNEEITPRPIKGGNSSYLIKNRDGSNIFHDLIAVRNELGKITEFRFYREYFNYFDDFMSFHESKKPSDRGDFPYEKIEVVCAAFLHEPYLYDRIREIVPDVIDKIEEFVNAIIFEKKLNIAEFRYKWTINDIIHLFFIAYKNERLIDKLTEANFEQLIQFAGEKVSSLNYMFYKLSAYFPLSVSEVNQTPYNSSIIQSLAPFSSIENPKHKELIKFSNFLKTLPTNQGFDSQIRHLRENYERSKAKELHDNKASFNHNISLIISNIRSLTSDFENEKQTDSAVISKIQEIWFDLLDFINPILSFSSAFSDYLAPSPYFKLLNKVENDATSLRAFVGINEDLVLNLENSNVEKLKKLEKNIIWIQTNFGLNSDFHNLIVSPNTIFSQFYNRLLKELNLLDLSITSRCDVPETATVKLPLFYTDKLLLKELIINMKKHCSPNGEVEINCYHNDNKIVLEIANPITIQTVSNSSGEGLKCLALLDDSELFDFKYQSKPDKKKFYQTLIFKYDEHTRN